MVDTRRVGWSDPCDRHPMLAWQFIKGKGDNEIVASGNGRIEATETDVAAKLAGRIKAILVDEGDLVTAGQVVAQMDTEVLQAQLRQAEAHLD